MPQGVKCSVADCTYWGQGNRCEADQIMIDVDKHARAEYATEFASESGLSIEHRDRAGDSGSTCCHTFRPKE